MLDPAATVVIVNPAAAGGRVGRQLDDIKRSLVEHLGPVTVRSTTHAGHGTELAAQSVRQGATELVSLGGDGTHNEVVNGIMAAREELADQDPARDALTLGVLPAGTGGDFRRVLSHGDSLESALRHLADARLDRVDVGRCTYTDDDGASAQRWFINIASCGISGLVCRIANASSKRLGGKATFYMSTLRAMAAYHAAPVAVTVDGNVVGDYHITSLQACNARYAGGGMMFAPDALLDDGLLDLVILEDPGLFKTLAMSGDIYKGTHTKLGHVHVYRGRDIQIDPLDPSRPAWVDIDGEAPGKAPARFQVVPGAIRLRGALPEVLSAR
ncbi:MAG: YegS/Rv2252/BmrU family lipid kinase [Oligoflexia bacterium]|nr:YegS/Rv2252/BmrU family lipid kinase [Oligoflexia bacterium]